MLKYFILLSIIYFCNLVAPMRRFTGDYDQLVFVVRSPASTIFEQMYNLGNDSGAANKQTIEVLKEIRSAYVAQKWVIHGLWGLKMFEIVENCVDEKKRDLNDSSRTLNSTFKAQLAKAWPNLDGLDKDEVSWQLQYNVYGSCIKPTAVEYFEKAMNLLHNHSIGDILANSGIYPGRSYSFYRIYNAILHNSRCSFNVICLLDQERDKQYLLEIQLCLDEKYPLRICVHGQLNLCDPRKSVFYPGPRKNL